jgi:hypothetical protein
MIFTHDQIDLTTGVLASAKGILWGLNALQSITIGRHTPKDKQQAIGYLGTVDYTSGVVTSDVSLDCLLVEGCNAAEYVADTTSTSVYEYAKKQMTIGSENYVLTSCGVQFQGGSAATVSYGWLTAGLASYLETKASPGVSQGEESDFCVVMGDDGSGLLLVPTWSVAPANVALATGIPIITAAGAYGGVNDNQLPAGVQSIGFNSTINRDQVLDVRSTSPCQFVTQYPVDITMDIELYVLPTHASIKHNMQFLTGLSVVATNLNKHLAGSAATKATNNKPYVKSSGLVKMDESESTQVGRYLSYNFQYDAADLLVPLPGVTIPDTTP